MTARQKIETVIAGHAVVLFMKGSRGAPQCGFSARTVDILDDYLEDYETVDVLVDPELREEIKAFSNWPTIPQLYVRGKLVGGADIVQEMAQSGELAGVLGKDKDAVPPPEVTITEAAAKALSGFCEEEGVHVVRLTIGADFEALLDLDEEKEGDVALELGALTFVMARSTARRADGVHIDFVEKDGASGFKVDVPGAPARVKQISAPELAAMLASGKPLLLIDVRTDEERAIAKIEGAVPLDEELRVKLEDLDRHTPIVFHCHHGVRSQRAAQHCTQMGFRDVSNLQGGIDAWSASVDPAVARY